MDTQERLRQKYRPISENARRVFREHIEKKGKVDNSDECNRSTATQEKIDALEDLMGQVDAYVDEIFEDFITEVAKQHCTMLGEQ